MTFSLLIAAALVTAIYITTGAVRDHRRVRTYNEKHPPITDEEFLCRCSPRVTPEVALKVRRMVADILPVEYERVHPDSHFSEMSRD